MRKILLSLLLTPVAGQAQIITSVGDGNFLNPFSWDCTCVPSDGDSLVINHDIVSNTDIYYTSGRIWINMSGSLTEDATERAIWIDGGSLVNFGVFTFHKLWLSAGVVDNSSQANIDSVWNQASFYNSGNILTYDIINDETAGFINAGVMEISHDMNNQGNFYNINSINLGNDFSNCNIQTMDAIFENNGTFCIANDFTNCMDDTLTGSGHYFIGGSSSNFGVFDGTFTFHTPSGTIGVPGNIQSGVTVTTGACNISVTELNEENIALFPSPVKDYVTINTPDQVEVAILSTCGQIVFEGHSNNGKIDLEAFEAGIYIVQLKGYKAQKIVKL